MARILDGLVGGAAHRVHVRRYQHTDNERKKVASGAIVLVPTYLFIQEESKKICEQIGLQKSLSVVEKLIRDKLDSMEDALAKEDYTT